MRDQRIMVQIADQALTKRSAEAVMRLRLAIVEVAEVYARLDPGERGLEGDARSEARGQLERVAELWREAELVGSWEVEREIGWEGPGDLLGAFADSLTLALSSNPERRAAVLDIDEGIERFEALDAQGAFEGLERTGAAPSAHGEQSPHETQLVEHFDALADQAIMTISKVFTFYRGLSPDGRALDARSVEAVERLEEAAATSLTLDAGRGLVARFAERRDLRLTVALLRALENALVLALSEDPARRAKAMPVEELQGRMRPVYEGWRAPTEQEWSG